MKKGLLWSFVVKHTKLWETMHVQTSGIWHAGNWVFNILQYPAPALKASTLHYFTIFALLNCTNVYSWGAYWNPSLASAPLGSYRCVGCLHMWPLHYSSRPVGLHCTQVGLHSIVYTNAQWGSHLIEIQGTKYHKMVVFEETNNDNKICVMLFFSFKHYKNYFFVVFLGACSLEWLPKCALGSIIRPLDSWTQHCLTIGQLGHITVWST